MSSMADWMWALPFSPMKKHSRLAKVNCAYVQHGGLGVGTAHLALLLLVLGVLADHHDLALAADDLALFTNRLNRRPDLHVQLPPCSSLLSPCCAR